MALQYMPHIAAIHYEEADSPTECQFLMTPSFAAQVYEAQADIPSYRNWLLHEADYLPAFRFHKRMLQALQHHAGGRWTLKNPWHPLFLNELTQVYPDARLVMTHRDPAEVVGSCCSLIKYVRAIYSDDVDLKGIGESFIDTFETMIARAGAFKAKHGAGAIHDVQYADTMRDPLGVVRGIYERFDIDFTPQIEAAMQGYHGGQPQGQARLTQLRSGGIRAQRGGRARAVQGIHRGLRDTGEGTPSQSGQRRPIPCPSLHATASCSR